jgi:hypothetical protein
MRAISTSRPGFLRCSRLRELTSAFASDDTALTFDYFQKTPALSGALNWLYTNHPDAYLFGSLCEANAFNKGQAFDAASLWKTRRDEVFNEIAMLDFNERQGMAIRVLGITP